MTCMAIVSACSNTARRARDPGIELLAGPEVVVEGLARPIR